jgi:flagellar biosynthesis protein FlhF
MKTYFSTTVEAAVELARRELGPEAMLVNSRPAPEEVKHLGRYEVIFATGAPRELRTAERSPSQNRFARKPVADTERQLEDIRLQLTTIRQTLWNSRQEPEAGGFSPETSMLRRLLEANGVEPEMTRELLQSVMRRNPAAAGRDQLRHALIAEMEGRLTTDSTVHKEGFSRATIALVGPPGRGKSTTLVKLAVAHGLARRSAVRILSMDNYRVGAGEQMRSYAAALGVSFHACDSIAELDHQLGSTWGSETRKPSLTLIDTSGYSPRDMEEAAELAAYFSTRPEINVHLVLRADGKSADGIRAVQRYSDFGISRLIFTGIDEADSVGSVFNTAVQTGKPISFLGTGQRIPEDLEPASSLRIVQLVFGREADISVAA